MMYEMTSESSDVNVSDSVNATTAETSTASPVGHVSPTNAIIVRATILLILAVFNLSGNGFTLITIRLTPRLWTKTNFILASMLVSNVITGINLLWYTAFLVVVYIFNNPCSYNVAVTVIMSFLKMPGTVGMYHLILISMERYIAIVHPLKYEIKFTDRTMKLAIAAAWVVGILVAISWSFWAINADLSKCDLVPGAYYVTEVVLTYIPICICMFFVYGKILVISWRQSRRIEPINTPSPSTSVQSTTVITLPPTPSNNDDITQQDSKRKPLTSTGPPSQSAVTNVGASADVTQQQRQKIKSRRREFKAVYLTAAIVGTFVILWFPNILARILAWANYNTVAVNYLFMIGGSIGASNFAFAWVIYAAVSRSYRRAYRQVLTRIGCCCCKNVTPQGDNAFNA